MTEECDYNSLTNEEVYNKWYEKYRNMWTDQYGDNKSWCKILKLIPINELIQIQKYTHSETTYSYAELKHRACNNDADKLVLILEFPEFFKN